MRRRSRRIAILLGLLCASAVRAQEGQEPRPTARDRAAERPAPTLQPTVPSIDHDGTEGAPPARRLARDGALSDRFVDEGQSVRYSFESQAHELSIFDIGTWGYARGWTSAMGLRILGPDGATLEELTRNGGTLYRKLLCFVAPVEGTYQLELSAPEHFYRYTVVRHSGYLAREPDTFYPFGAGDLVHGYLSTADDRVTYLVDLPGGRPVTLRVSHTHPQARKQFRAFRARQPLRVVRGEPVSLPLPAGRAAMEKERRTRERLRAGAGSLPYASFVLQVTSEKGEPLGDRQPLEGGTHFVLLTAPRDGLYRVSVAANSMGDGGLFDLVLDREPTLEPVTGYVGDQDDEPVGGVTVHFLREPEMDYLGRVVSGEEGTWSLDLPPGAYTLLVQRGDDGPLERIQVGIEDRREVNLIYPH